MSNNITEHRQASSVGMMLRTQGCCHQTAQAWECQGYNLSVARRPNEKDRWEGRVGLAQ